MAAATEEPRVMIEDSPRAFWTYRLKGEIIGLDKAKEIVEPHRPRLATPIQAAAVSTKHLHKPKHSAWAA
jgi:hypothetical protein